MSGCSPPITRDDMADYVSTLITVYIVLIFIRILMGWFTRIPYNRALERLAPFVPEVTDPYLNMFRRFIPTVRIGPGALDLSPIVAVLVLSIVGGIVVRLDRAARVTRRRARARGWLARAVTAARCRRARPGHQADRDRVASTAARRSRLLRDRPRRTSATRAWRSALFDGGGVLVAVLTVAALGGAARLLRVRADRPGCGCRWA